MKGKVCPLNLRLVPSPESESFKSMEPGETALPLRPHPGAFGTVRKHHAHEGVDLYAPEGSEVFAIEAGVVDAAKPFTGPKAGSPWWLDTEAVFVRGASGTIVYGEIDAEVRVGDKVEAGDRIGRVRRVLRNDKGRPTSMLHLELRKNGYFSVDNVQVGEAPPEWLLDPTPLLMEFVEPR